MQIKLIIHYSQNIRNLLYGMIEINNSILRNYLKMYFNIFLLKQLYFIIQKIFLINAFYSC